MRDLSTAEFQPEFVGAVGGAVLSSRLSRRIGSRDEIDLITVGVFVERHVESRRGDTKVKSEQV